MKTQKITQHQRFKMSNLLTAIIMLICTVNLTYSQNSVETIQDFFTALNAKDAEKLNGFMIDDLQLNSLSIGDKLDLKSSTKVNFIANIKGIPDDINIEEKIFDIEYKETEFLAQVWTPYEFYINGKLSHKGINAFTLVKIDDKWIITSITDTRQR